MGLREFIKGAREKFKEKIASLIIEFLKDLRTGLFDFLKDLFEAIAGSAPGPIVAAAATILIATLITLAVDLAKISPIDALRHTLIASTAFARLLSLASLYELALNPSRPQAARAIMNVFLATLALRAALNTARREFFPHVYILPPMRIFVRGRRLNLENFDPPACPRWRKLLFELKRPLKVDVINVPRVRGPRSLRYYTGAREERTRLELLRGRVGPIRFEIERPNPSYVLIPSPRERIVETRASGFFARAYGYGRYVSLLAPYKPLIDALRLRELKKRLSSCPARVRKIVYDVERRERVILGTFREIVRCGHHIYARDASGRRFLVK